MAAQFPTVGQVRSGSVSPRSEGQLSRKDAKKLISDEIKVLKEAVKYHGFYSLEVGKNGGKPVDITLSDGQKFTIGRPDIRFLRDHILKKLGRLPNRAIALTKSRRKVPAHSGFDKTSRFQQSIADFFRTANLGPMVDGQLAFNDRGKYIPHPDGTLTPRQDTRLNDALYFTMRQVNGRDNPQYAIYSPGKLTPLFALHAYYENMVKPNVKGGRMSASAQMRRDLGEIMRATIQKDIAKIKSLLPGRDAEFDQLSRNLQESINNPNAEYMSSFAVPSRGKPFDLFNPNNFPHAHFSKLISLAKANGGALSDSELNQIETQTAAAYSNIVQGVTAGNAINTVLDQQKRTVTLSTGYKNLVKKNAEKEAKRVAKAAT